MSGLSPQFGAAGLVVEGVPFGCFAGALEAVARAGPDRAGFERFVRMSCRAFLLRLLRDQQG